MTNSHLNPVLGGSYRITSPTIGIAAEDGSSRFTLPKDTILIVTADSTDGLVEVTWAGRELRMFAVDLLERAELIDSK